MNGRGNGSGIVTEHLGKKRGLMPAWRTAMFRRVPAVLVWLVMLFAVASCSVQTKRYTIGVAQCSEDSWRKKLNEELRTSTYLYDNVDVVFASADDDDNRQREQIEHFVNSGVDLLIVSPNQMNSVSDAIDKAYDRGIPVILLDRRTASGKYTAFIGADNVEIGRSIGELVARRLGGRGNVVEIQGLRGSSPAIERHKGFAEALGRYPDIHIVASAHGTWLQESGRTAMDSVLKSLDGTVVDCVFGHNDRMAIGAVEAMRADGTADSAAVVYAGVDALPTADGGIARVHDGTLTMSCIYPTRGDVVMQLALDILEGRPYDKENTLQAALVTKDNAAVMLMQAGEMQRQNEVLDTLHDRVDVYFARYNHQKVYLLLFATIVLLLIVFFIMAYRTVVIRRRMAVDAANAKLVFFTNMSHEFRTPLTLIADPVEQMLTDDNLTPRQRDRLEIVNRNARVLLRLVGEVLDFRKLQNGKMELMASRFCLTDHAAKWIESFRPMAESKGIRLTCETPADGITVCNDLYKIERICYNLLSNAMKHTMRNGSITLRVERDGTDMVRLSVADTGVGIPRDKLPHVFDRFFMVKSSAADGTGIGLAIVKAFTEIMGGTVSASSEEGHGSVFMVRLPVEVATEAAEACGRGVEHAAGEAITRSGASSCAPAAEPAAVAAEAVSGSASASADVAASSSSAPADVASASASDKKGNRPMILIADDSDDIRAYIASLLADRYDVVQAENGKDGLERAMECVPDLIISDVMMPVMDGLDMCRRLKQETATSHIPVLMLTARTLEEQRAEGYDCGADAYITKPFSGKVLLSRVENLLENRRRLRKLFAANLTDLSDGANWAGKPGLSNGADWSDLTNGADMSDRPDTSEASADAPSLNVADTRFISKLHDVIAANLADSELSVETISSEMGLSRVQLYRKVKALTGATPVEMIRTARLTQAEALLREGGRTVSEISYAVGFSSPSYFIKCYKDHFGHTPAAKA